MIRTLFFFLTLSLCFPALCQDTSKIDSLIEKANHLGLAQSNTWLNLGHYKKNIWGSYQSEADGRNFFVSPEGTNNPQAELEATLRGFLSATKRDLGKDQPQQSVRCQFPARWIYLSKSLGIDPKDIPDQRCPEFEKFQMRSQAESVTMVFASYNVSNPSSTFGHSLMRLNKAATKNSSPLLDLGVNYAANPSTTNPFLYAVFGLAGVFPGTFAAMPYFYKVREYSDFDARDLWEYNLDLTPAEVDMLVAHLWELGFTYFDYYFFTENCSYHMLSLLDVAAPRLNLLDRTRYWVIPADTIKTITRTPGLLKSVNFRPSLNKILQARLDNFQESSDRKYYFSMAKDFNLSEIPDQLSPDRKAQILDAVIDRFDSQYFEALVNEDSAIKAQKIKLLIARSRLPSAEPLAVTTAANDQPHLSHDSSRWGFTHLRSTSGNSRFEIQRRLALHDYLDPVDGYPETAKIEFFNIAVSGSWDRTDFYLKNFDLVSVQTTKPINSLETPISWSGRIAVEKVNDERCQMCLAGTGAAGAGLTVNILGRTNAYFMATGALKTSPDFNRHKWTIQSGPLLGIRAIFYPNLIFHMETAKSWILNFDQPITQNIARLRWAPNLKWSIEAGYREELSTNEYLGSVYYYF